MDATTMTTTMMVTTTTTSFNANNETELQPAYPVILAATLLSGIELAIVHPLATLISIFNCLLLVNTKLLHANLKCILIGQSLSIIICEICRINYVALKFINANMFFNGAYAIQTMAVTSINFRNLLIHFLLAERLLATICYKKYEKWQKPYFGIASVAILIFLSIWLTFNQNGSPWSVSTSTIVIFGAIMAIDFIQIIIILILYSKNRENYKIGMALRLGQKFQLSENMRTSRQLTPTFLFHAINICANCSISFLIYFKLVESRHYISLCFVLAAIVNGIANFLIELTVITHHQMMKRKARNWLLCLRNAIKGNRIGVASNHASKYEVNDGIRDIDGRQLKNLPGREKHFEMLESCWK